MNDRSLLRHHLLPALVLLLPSCTTGVERPTTGISAGPQPADDNDDPGDGFTSTTGGYEPEGTDETGDVPGPGNADETAGPGPDPGGTEDTGGPPDPTGTMDCDAGPCCNGGQFEPAGTVCDDDVDSELGCPWGVANGSDVGRRTRDRTCSGASAACDGPLGEWEEWTVEDDCSSTEFCDPGASTCSAAPPTCNGGPCCDGTGDFRPAGFVCEADAETEYSCPWGTSNGDDVGVRHRDRTCSGGSESCNGPLGAWGPWQTHDNCSNSEVCSPGDATCNPAPPMPPEPDCASGACCDPSGFYRPAGYVCDVDADSDYGCPWGTSPGDDVGVRYRDRTCSGTSSSCNGAYTGWSSWQTQDFCTSDEVCDPGDPSCDPAPCTETDYWSPTTTSNDRWDRNGVQLLRFEKQEVNGNLIEARVCKIGGGDFTNDIHLDYEEWAKYFGWFMVSDTIDSMGADCSDWVDLDTSTWSEGESIGAQIRVVSPAWCAPQWDDQCNVDPSCGTCWYWLSDTVMTRTCRP
ncbi:MAG: hypothetical protein AAF799_29090 [Myxococcota bacterium]